MATPADLAIQYALAQVGKPYEWGATGPNSFDCSGLVYAAYQHAGITLGRTTFQQIVDGVSVSESELAAGDLRFPDAGHVQLYLGGGKIVEAPTQGENVRVTDAWGSTWAARRVSAPATLNNSGIAQAGYLQVGNPLASGQAALASADKFAGLIGDPAIWIRIAEMSAGIICLMLGIGLIIGVKDAKRVITQVAGTVSSGSKEVAHGAA